MPHNSFTGRFEVSQWSCGQTRVQCKTLCHNATADANYICGHDLFDELFPLARNLIENRTQGATNALLHHLTAQVFSL